MTPREVLIGLVDARFNKLQESVRTAVARWKDHKSNTFPTQLAVEHLWVETHKLLNEICALRRTDRNKRDDC